MDKVYFYSFANMSVFLEKSNFLAEKSYKIRYFESVFSKLTLISINFVTFICKLQL